MERLSVRYEPKWMIRLTSSDVQLMTEASKSHYDEKCRDLSALGGTIYGFNNQLEWAQPEAFIEVEVSRRDVDIFCKVLELAYLIRDCRPLSFNLQSSLMQLLHEDMPEEAKTEV